MLIFLPEVFAQHVRKSRFDTGIDLSPAAASERWAEFASARLAGDYCMTFKIEHRPRRAKEVYYSGYMLGGERPDGTYTRVHIQQLSDATNSADYILKSSPKGSMVWKFQDGAFVEVPKADWLKPMCKGLVYSPFDLLMPYKFWKCEYAGAGRIGQAVHLYNLKNPDFSGIIVEVALTRDFNAPAKISIIGASCDKTARLGSVKRIGDVWITREASAKDDISKDSDILRFTAAKFGLNWGMAPFLSSAKKEVELPALERL